MLASIVEIPAVHDELGAVVRIAATLSGLAFSGTTSTQRTPKRCAVNASDCPWLPVVQPKDAASPFILEACATTLIPPRTLKAVVGV